PALEQLPETISTCRFAQRVAMIRQEARVNEEVDPHLLVRKLKAEVQQLRDQLAFYAKDGGGGAPDRVLSDDEKQRCAEMVRRFVAATNGDARIEGFDGDLARIYYCFEVLKGMLSDSGAAINGAANGQKQQLQQQQQQQQEEVDVYRARVDALEMSLRQKENEMNTLFDMLQKTQRARYNAETQTGMAADASCSRTIAAAAAAASPTGVFAPQMSSPSQRGSASFTSSPLVAGLPTANTAYAAAGDAPQHHHSLMTRRVLDERLGPAEATAVGEFFRKQEQLNEVYDLSALTDAELLQDRATAFEAFSRSYRQCAQVEENKRELKGRYEACKATARQLNGAVDSIKHIKAHIQRLRAERALQGVEEVDEAERAALEELTSQKASYNELAESLRRQKEEIDAMHLFMKRAQEQLTKDFEDWLQIRQKQLARAIGGGGSNATTTNTAAKNNNSNGIALNGGGVESSRQATAATAPSSALLPPRSSHLFEQQQRLNMTTPGAMAELPPLREESGISARTWGGSSSSSTANGRILGSNGLSSSVGGGGNNVSSSNRSVLVNTVERVPPHPSTAPPTTLAMT
ncbi:kinesin, partial [Trypanosoma grayi]|uniref:kinesin n=1 Tax=Trypanosoma grayi TaxID=71804 RepID=UPI0004F4B8C0